MATTPPDDLLREHARRRLRARRSLLLDVAAYVLCNTLFVILWAAFDRGYFWPAWPLIGWGFFLFLDAWYTLAPYYRPITDAKIDREVDRLRRRSGGGATP